MINIPAVAKKRIVTAVPKFRKVLERARERDVNEADTVIIVTDILEEVFGFDKYTEITREYAIQGTYCDLAIKTEKKVEYLIEVKAVGIGLKESHLRQIITYASQEGIKYVVLTNGVIWELHRVTVEDRVKNQKLIAFDFTSLNPRRREDREALFLLCKRGVQKDLIDEFYEYRQSVNRYTVGAVILTDPVVSVIRRELRRIKDGLKVTNEEIEELVKNEVLKRDLIESETAKETYRNVRKLLRKSLKKKLRSKPKALPRTTPDVAASSDGER